jgi:alkanesulfonate monooxygenase SsuD/methylene tetrahydromethanopterin reductase-like flavin-dependent oxidoreductase (luciferase family)
MVAAGGSILCIVEWPECRTQERAPREALEQIERTDLLGIDEVGLGEHHFPPHGLLSGLIWFSGHAAARAERIRKGEVHSADRH